MSIQNGIKELQNFRKVKKLGVSKAVNSLFFFFCTTPLSNKVASSRKINFFPRHIFLKKLLILHYLISIVEAAPRS